MIDSLVWVGAVIAAAILAVARFARGIHKGASNSPREDAQSVAVTHAKESIKNKYIEATEQITEAETGKQSVEELADIANRARK